MSIADKLAIIAENEQKVYDAGKQAEWNVFWDALQQNGTRTSYENAFGNKGWSDNNFKPKYDIINIGDYSCSQSFRQSKITDLKGILEKQKVEYNTKGATRFINTFQACDVTRVPTLYLDSCTTINNAFSSSSLTEVEMHNLQENCTFINPFNRASRLSSLLLKNCTIGQNGLNLKDSTKLSRASIESVINSLSTTTTDLTVTLSKTAVDNAFTVGDNLFPHNTHTHEQNGVTLTENGDGSITLNGTATSTCFFIIDENLALSKGQYEFYISDTSKDVYLSVDMHDTTTSSYFIVEEGGNSELEIIVDTREPLNNVTLYPSIRKDGQYDWQMLLITKSNWTISLV